MLRTRQYAAYLTFPLAKGSTNIVAQRVDLGEAAFVNEAIDIICNRMSSGRFAARHLPELLQALSKRIFYGPLSEYLTNVFHLIICPDGELSRLPFEMLSHNGRFLIEDKTISYVTRGREVVRLAQRGASVNTNPPLIMGNPDFDLDFGTTHWTPRQVTMGTNLAIDVLPLAGARGLGRSFQGQKFKHLPEADKEARSIAKMLAGLYKLVS